MERIRAIIRSICTYLALLWRIFSENLSDMMLFGGLAMAFCGLHMLAPWLAYLVVGAALFVLGVVASIPRRS